jgi:hypothetical protein
MHNTSSPVDRSSGSRRPPRAALLASLLIGMLMALSWPASAATGSGRFRFEGNKWLKLELEVAGVRADLIRFDWPSTMMGVKTGYKSTVKLVNGSTRQARIGLAVILYDGDGRPVGAGTTGTKLGTIDPGDAAEFTVDFDYVTERLEQSEQFAVVLEYR